MKNVLFAISLLFISCFIIGCDLEGNKSADQDQTRQQETLAREASAQTGMPAIKNFRERKILKMLLELRDQENLTTYTYVYSNMTGKYTYIGESIGFALSGATQYTNPQKIEAAAHSYGYAILPQADPNQLFSPSSTEGSWVLLKDPNGKDVHPFYSEERLTVSTFKLPSRIVVQN